MFLLYNYPSDVNICILIFIQGIVAVELLLLDGSSVVDDPHEASVSIFIVVASVHLSLSLISREGLAGDKHYTQVPGV